MAPRLSPLRQRFSREFDLVGLILTEYGELEIDLLNCVQVRSKQFDEVFKEMFRTRGEKRRIELAAEIGRGPYHHVDLGGEFDATIDNVQHCREIRNQYAHAYWTKGYDDRLVMADLENLATKNEHIPNLLGLTFSYIDLDLLTKQAEFSWNVQSHLHYLNWEGRYRAGELSETQRLYPEPPVRFERPPLHWELLERQA